MEPKKPTEFPSPFPGLRLYKKAEHFLFVGRDKERSNLIVKLANHNFLALIGPSGAGKSSLLYAGLVGEFESPHSRLNNKRWKSVTMRARPYMNPFEKLADKFEKKQITPFFDKDKLIELSKSEDGIHPIFGEDFKESNLKDSRLIILIDQFEEILISGKNSHRFIKLLLNTIYPKSKEFWRHSIYVIVALRSEDINNCANFPGLSDAINRGLFFLPLLTEKELKEIFNVPSSISSKLININKNNSKESDEYFSKYYTVLEDYSYLKDTVIIFDDDLVEYIIKTFLEENSKRENKASSSLPFLQYALNYLWKEVVSEKIAVAQSSPNEKKSISINLDDFFHIFSDNTQDNFSYLLEKQNFLVNKTSYMLVKNKIISKNYLKCYPDIGSINFADFLTERLEHIYDSLKNKRLDKIASLIFRQLVKYNCEGNYSSTYCAQEELIQLILDQELIESDLLKLRGERNILQSNISDFLSPVKSTDKHKETARKALSTVFNEFEKEDFIFINRRDDDFIRIQHDVIINHLPYFSDWSDCELKLTEYCDDLWTNRNIGVHDARALCEYFNNKKITNTKLKKYIRTQEDKYNEYNIDYSNGLRRIENSLAETVKNARSLTTKELNEKHEFIKRKKELENEILSKKVNQLNKYSIISILLFFMLIFGVFFLNIIIDEEKINHLDKKNKEINFNGAYENAVNAASIGNYKASQRYIEEAKKMLPYEENKINYSKIERLASFIPTKSNIYPEVTMGEKKYPFSSIAIDDNEKYLAVAGEHGYLGLFDIENKKKIASHSDGSTVFTKILFSHNSNEIILVTLEKSGIITLWEKNNNTLEKIKTYKFKNDNSYALALHPNKNILAVSESDNIRLFKITEDNLSPLSSISLSIKSKTLFTSISFNYNATLLAATVSFFENEKERNVVYLVNIDDKVKLSQPEQLTYNSARLEASAFSPSGKTLAIAGKDKSIYLWDVQENRQIKNLTGHKDVILTLKFLDETHIISGGRDSDIRIWNIEAASTMYILQAHSSNVQALAKNEKEPDKDEHIANKNIIYSAGYDGKIFGWDLNSFHYKYILTNKDGLTGMPISAAISPDLNYIAVGFQNGKIALFKKDGALISYLSPHTKSIFKIIFNKAGDKIVTASADKSVKVFDLKNGNILHSKTIRSDDIIYSVDISSDDNMIVSATNKNGLVLLTPLKNIEKEQVFQCTTDVVSSVKFSQDNSSILCTGDNKNGHGQASIWAIEDLSPRLIQKLVPDSPVSSLWATFSSDGNKVAEVGVERSINIWDLTTGEFLSLQSAGYESIFKVDFDKFSPGILAISADAKLRYWDISNFPKEGLLQFTLDLPIEIDNDYWDMSFQCGTKTKNCNIAIPLPHSGKVIIYSLEKPVKASVSEKG